MTERRAPLLDVAAATAAVAEEWVRGPAGIKQLNLASPLVGGEWLSGPYAPERTLLTGLDLHRRPHRPAPYPVRRPPRRRDLPALCASAISG